MDEPTAEVPLITLTHASYSAFSDYTHCALAFKLKRTEGLEEVPSWWGIGGSAVHRVTEILDRQRFDAEGW